MTARVSEFSRGWKVLLAGFLGAMCGASPLPINVLGFLFEPLEQAYGWNRTQVSLGITIFGVTAALLAPTFGGMADKYGVRRVGLWSLVAFIITFSALALTPPSLGVYYLLWFFVGLVGIGSTPVSWGRAINMWFVANRGLALGIMLIGTSVAAFLVPQIVVAANAAFGWRAIFPAVALMPLLLALPVILMFFREPTLEERPVGLAGGDGALAGMSLSEAMRTRQFWLLWSSILIISFAYGGAHTHLPSIARDRGIDMAAAAAIMGIAGFGLLVGRLGVGYLFDRYWGPAVAFPVLCLPALACYLLSGTAAGHAQISLAAFMLGFAAGAEADLIAYFAARYFGMAQFGRIYGMLYMPFGLMSAISPVAYGLVRDRTGSYDPILHIASLLFLVGGALLLFLGRYPEAFSRKAPRNN